MISANKLSPELRYTWKEKKNFDPSSQYLPAKGIIGNENCQYSVTCFTQFDPLKEVILGHIDSKACDNQEYQEYFNYVQEVTTDPFEPQIVDYSARNLEKIGEALQQHNVKVVRVGALDYLQQYEIQGMKSKGFCCFSPRDMPFTYHDTFYEFPGYNLCRAKQNLAFLWIEKQLKEKGSKIYESWLPIQRFANRHDIQSYKSENQYFVDAANLIKLGLDIIFLISQSGSVGAYKQFKKFMEQRYDNKVRVHPMANVYDGVHIDTTYSVIGFNKKLGKYLVFAEGFRTNPTNVPAIFRGENWMLIDFTEFEQEYFSDEQFNICSNSIGMNFLTVTPELAFISHLQTRLQKIMEFYGIKAVPLENKYAVQLGGGIHCVTNDIHREDTHGFSQIINKPTNQLSLEQRAGLFDPKLLTFLQSQGPIEDWPEICNRNNIFPRYATEHLNQEQKAALQHKHTSAVESYKLKSSTENV